MKYLELFEARGILVYHGTDKQFSNFETGHKNGMTVPRMGFYFTDTPKAARQFGAVSAYYIYFNKPANFFEGEGQDILNAVLEANPELKEHYTKVVTNRYGPGVSVSRVRTMGLLQTDEFILTLKQLGYDCMIFDDDFAGYDFTSYVIFSPSQIKKAKRQPKFLTQLEERQDHE